MPDFVQACVAGWSCKCMDLIWWPKSCSFSLCWNSPKTQCPRAPFCSSSQKHTAFCSSFYNWFSLLSFFSSDFLRSILTERSFSCLQRTKWEETLTFDLSHFLNNKKVCRTYMLLVKYGLSSSTSDPCSTEGEIALGELKKSSKDKSLAKPSRGSDLGLFEMTCSLKLSCGV